MSAPVVYDNVAQGANLQGQLFAGKKFWVAQRVHERPRYLDLIRANGGEIVLLEKKADYLIADHLRKDCPPGSISYTFIDKSIEAGEIQDPKNHLAGPAAGTARPPGSVTRPAKSTKAAYTAAEDRILYKWVHDHEKAGGLVSGNEIYKQLEKLHPRHTWQSWRDRYLKILRNRPPSAFNIPDNAPPSPPSDAPAEPAAAPPPTQPRKPTAGKQASASGEASVSNRAKRVEEYTVDDFEALFGKEDWEYLYAFVEDIDTASGEEYHKAWEAWAKDEGTKTAEQWRQYYEKVVRPQWLRDPPAKRQEVKKRVEERLNPDDPEAPEDPQESPSPPGAKAKSGKRKRSDSEENLFESYLNARHKGRGSSAYVIFARENKWQLWEENPDLDYTGLHTLLMSKWEALSSEEKAPYFAQGAAENEEPAHETVTLSSQVWLPSSSTVVNQTPSYITEAYNKALKQIRKGFDRETSPADAETGPLRPAKRQRSSTPLLGTKQEPVAISSASGTSSQESIQDKLPEVGSVEQLVEDEPTPRALRYKASAFDTQAVLSSPSQGASLRALPPPPESEAEDPDGDLFSDASTTQSIREYRRSLNADFSPQVEPIPHPEESPPPRSPTSSTGSEDPDPPLALDEVDEFFKEQNKEGFTDVVIAKALKHTRCRPDLAIEVLQAWKEHRPLPLKRGIWSEEDDEEVEAGDQEALEELAKKHSLDGWGGITERMNFLAKYNASR